VSDEKDSNKHCCKRGGHRCGGAWYGLGFLGAAVYFVQTSSGFWPGVWGVLKALVWPAFLVYKALELMKM
jgi:hypothetical protein